MSCYGCEKRHIGCHATCKDYLEEKAERDARNEKIRAERNKETIAIGMAIQGFENRKIRTRKPLKERIKK